MASDIDICNLALLRLGTRSTIASLTEGSVEANACNIAYPLIRDALLASHRWGFATRRTQLAVLGAPPPPWAFCYAFPTDCLAPHELYRPIPRLPVIPFEVSGSTDPLGNPIKVILTNWAQAMLVYTAHVTSPNLFAPHFIEALSWMLAAELATALTGDTNLAQYSAQMASSAVAAARARDANDDSKPQDRPAEWVRARGTVGDHLDWGVNQE